MPPLDGLKIPEYNLKEGVEKLAELIRAGLVGRKGPLIIEIAGGSASGKTSEVAMKIKDIFGEDAIVIPMDDYYRGSAFMKKEAAGGNPLNWDQPEALNLELLREHLARLKSGQSIQKSRYSFKTGESWGEETVQPKPLILVEGLFALSDLLAGEGDIRVFVDIGTHGRILRRLLRDIVRTGQKPADIFKYFSEIVEPMHGKYIEITKGNANLIIKNEYCPEIEAQKSDTQEVQLKFRAEIDPDILRKLGAERLSSIFQTDRYYDPRDRKLSETDELLRIREENNHRVLTYKGPKMASPFRRRPKFEFEIDEEIQRRFLAIYGDEIKTVTKERTLYLLGGVVFSVDSSVTKTENGETVNLGNFIEIRSIEKGAIEEKLMAVLSELGLSVENGLKESYCEM